MTFLLESSFDTDLHTCPLFCMFIRKKNKLYRCPKFGGDAKQTLEIRVKRKRNLKLGELCEVSFRIYKLGELSFGIYIQVG